MDIAFILLLFSDQADGDDASRWVTTGTRRASLKRFVADRAARIGSEVYATAAVHYSV